MNYALCKYVSYLLYVNLPTPFLVHMDSNYLFSIFLYYKEKISFSHMMHSSTVILTDLSKQFFLKMSILYAVISQGPVVLARYASCAGNFQEVADQILAQANVDTGPNRMTFTHGKYLTHFTIANGVIYLCITDDVSVLNIISINIILN